MANSTMEAITEQKNNVPVNEGNNYLFLRRILEVFLLFLISPIIILLFLILSFVVFIDSRGKIIYSQVRVGKNGKPFTMYKFRTMNEMPKCQNNYFVHQKSRVTKPGNFLRKHRLDELPQVWNILKGDMSFIGPRPEIIELYFYFLNSIPEYFNRTIILPGITGWAQVNYYHTMTIEGNSEKLKYDMYYMNNISLKLDLIILLKTLKVVIIGKNSE